MATFSYKGHQYQLTSAPMSWTEAEAQAISLGGHLVTVNDADENNWLYNTFSGATQQLWIGLSDAASEGVWKWADGSGFNYSNWLPAQPDNAGDVENYVHLWQGQGGGWNDIPNSLWGWNVYGIIEISTNIITGDGAGNNLLGSSGSDKITALGGDDTLVGNNGDDTLIGGAGIDKMYGGVGNDTYYVDNISDIVVESSDTLNGGIDTVVSSVARSLGNYQENLTLSGLAAIDAVGNNLNNVIKGNSANNVIKGLVGDDTLVGNNGDDTLVGGSGIDKMYGGLGNDTYYVDNINDVVIEPSDSLNGGIDTVITSVTFVLGNYLENITLSGFSLINATGNNLHNVIKGNSADNIIKGGAGNDTLSGGGGLDTLTGGDGADHFLFKSASEGCDVICDFTSGSDKVVIDGAGFGINDLIFSSSNSGLPMPSQAKPYLLYNLDNGELWFDKDGSGNAAATQVADLEWSLLSETQKLLSSDIIISQGSGGGFGTYSLNQDQVKLLGLVKSGFGIDNSHVSNVTVATNGFISGSNLSGQCVSYVKNARSDLNSPWGGGAINGLATFSNSHEINTSIPIVGSAFVLDPSTRIKPISGSLSALVGHSTYGHTGIVTSVDMVRDFDDSGNSIYSYQVGVSDSNRAGEFLATRASRADDVTEADAAMRSSVIKIGLDETGDQAKVSFIWDAKLVFDAERLNIQSVIGQLYDAGLISSDAGRAEVISSAELIDVFYIANTELKFNNYINLIELLNVEKSTPGKSVAPTYQSLSVANDLVRDVLSGATVGTGVDDTMTGTSANDIFMGGAGNDTLTGGAGRDELIGGLGADKITGGAGRDILTGGSGNDTFDFNSVGEMGVSIAFSDVITDFQLGDKIDLSTIDANSTTPSNDTFQYLGSVSEFTAAGQIRFDGTANVLYGNTDANTTTSEFLIKLSGVGSLSASDFVL